MSLVPWTRFQDSLIYIYTKLHIFVSKCKEVEVEYYRSNHFGSQSNFSGNKGKVNVDNICEIIHAILSAI